MSDTAQEVDPSLGAWEAAYQRFETPAEEIAKFRKRLLRLGAGKWGKEARIVELFCGRGNGLEALAGLGFGRLTGVDLSPRLASQYKGAGEVVVADCRRLPLESGIYDVGIVQGGLHHLPALPGDLAMALDEAKRILRPGGLMVIVEPWLTPFLRGVHFLSRRRAVRALSRKFGALATMIENERETYENWLSRPEEILRLVRGRFEMEREEIGWGKLMAVGRRGG